MDTRPRELSLFSGAGGGLLATQHLLGFRTVCYVEIDKYCQQVLQARIRDSFLDDAPIWDDVRTFDGRPWRGCVDVLTAGFPCQPFSTAARGRKISQNLWGETERVVKQIHPELVFAENVSVDAIYTAAIRLEALGYTPQCISLSASDLGADHIRQRYWLAAHADDKGELCSPLDAEMAQLPGFRPSIWETYAAESRVVNGLAHRVDRLRAIGNGQIPAVAATAWEILMETT